MKYYFENEFKQTCQNAGTCLLVIEGGKKRS